MNENDYMDIPLDWGELLGADEIKEKVSISDGLIYSLNKYGRVELQYISDITGATKAAVIKKLKGSIFCDPDKWHNDPYSGWVTADEYLSGNLKKKLEAAVRADMQHKRIFNDNIKAIQKLLPEPTKADDIYITLGSPWIPAKIIEDFIHYIFSGCAIGYIEVKHDEYFGAWKIEAKNRLRKYHASKITYGTTRMPALDILEKTLNMRTIAVMDEIISHLDNKKKKVINNDETILALEKQKKLIKKFQKWVWSDDWRKERLIKIFEEKYCSFRTRVYDGSFLKFPEMSKNVSLYPYQKNAVARIMFSPNTLLAHDVGSGKTYVMIATGMELRRMGTSKKNMYVVPNNLIGQWRDIFQRLYPNAKLLLVDAKSFSKDKRQDVLADIRDNEYDGIIITYSCFTSIPVSNQFFIDELKRKKKEIRYIHGELSREGKLKLSKIENEIEKLELSDEVEGICFDDLGVTRLFIDEAHNFKNVPIETKADHVLGISAGGSKKCQDMMNKVRLVQKQNSGGGVTMATATPLTNSITEAYIMQKYLQSGELAMLDLNCFDSWIGMFAERKTEFEIDVDTNTYRLATRFSKLHNLTELTTLLSSIADFHSVDSSDGIPELDGYDDNTIPKTAAFKAYLADISHRADSVRNGRVNRRIDNMLKITTDGRKAALDMRLVSSDSGDNRKCKAVRCADIAVKIYNETKAVKGTQLIFCDISTPKQGFNIYDEMRRLLCAKGIPPEEIAYIHSAKTEKSREELFRQVRSGDIRILLGSTFKLGLGVNIQDRLAAVHHLDVPWRPADMTQREGRILRQGNMNPKVQIFRYITNGSFDAYSWQLLETKQRFICELLSGSMSERSAGDISDTILNYAEVKALAVGNPLVKQRVEVSNELERLIVLQRKYIETRTYLEEQLETLPKQIKNAINLRKSIRKDNRHYLANKTELSDEERILIGEEIIHSLENPDDSKKIAEYQGFDIVPASDNSLDKYAVYVCREGKYYLKITDSPTVVMQRLDELFDSLKLRCTKISDEIKQLSEKYSSVKNALTSESGYSEQIEKYREKLNKLDEKLGVK